MKSKARKISVYNLSRETLAGKPYKKGIKIVKWTPGIMKFIPPNSSMSYLSFWVTHYLGLFKSRHYCAFVIYQEGMPICSLVCVPALYRWTFMKRDDLQIKNVFTSKEYRGQGLASALLEQVVQRLNKKDRLFWYMTHEDNLASINLCKKMGFKYRGEYRRAKNKFFFYQGEIV